MLQTSIMILIEGYQSPEITKKLKPNAKPKGNGNQAFKTALNRCRAHTRFDECS